jgi:hypothetical protein
VGVRGRVDASDASMMRCATRSGASSRADVNKQQAKSARNIFEPI